ncbi:MAG: shikimate kinase [Sedimentibacter sp.]
MNNLVLIGMPGCGKSTIGSLLSKRLNMDFIDMDDYIVKTEGKSVKEMFDIGENCFRDAETRCSMKLSQMNSIVISTGGGIIKRKENIDCFNKSSIIIFVNRPIEHILKDIDCEVRPLLAEGKTKLYNLYEERICLYKKYCHIEINNSGNIYDTIEEIVKAIENFK